MSTHILWRSVEAQLQRIRTIWLNTTRHDGHTHSVPVCYWWEDDGNRKCIYLITPMNTVKAQNLAYNPRVTLQTSEGEDAIILRGTAALVQDEDERQRISASCRAKYQALNGWDILPVFNRHQVVYAIDITHVRVWRYGDTPSSKEWSFEARFDPSFDAAFDSANEVAVPS